MAKVKQIKSMQERLEEAIVPKEQAPFAIPENWCWVKLFYLCQLQNGDKVVGDRLPYLDVKYLRGKSEGILKNEGVLLDKGQKIILVDGENSGEVFEIFERGYMGSTFRILSINKNVHVDLIQYFISFYQEELKNNKIGSAIPHLNKELFYSLSFPYAPIEEQKRIVDKIESLFSRLNEAKELIQKSLDEFEDRKSAILHKAFNGELVSFRKPERVTISEVARINPKTKKIVCDDNEMVPFVPMRAVSEASGKIKEVLFEKYEKVKKGFTYFEQGDVLFAKITPCMENGKCFIADDLKGGFGFASTEFYVFKISPKILNKYLWYILRHKTFRDNASHVMTGAVGQQRVPKQYLENCIITLPARGEQQEVVNILDSFFEKDDKSKALLDIIDQIEEMKKSILSRAFRGELGTHSDNDEPAIELVKKILSNN